MKDEERKNQERIELRELLERVKCINGDYFNRANWDGSVDFDTEEEEILIIKEVLIKILSKLLEENGA